MIVSFACNETEGIWNGRASRKLPRDIQDRVFRKLRQLEAALALDDLRHPPGNNLEALRGARKGQHSIRINRQWRICFVWENGDAAEVKIVDYH